MASVLVFGATSAIVQETLRHFAAEHSRFFLVGRDREKLEIVARDLEARGAAEVGVATADFADIDSHLSIVDGAYDALGACDVCLLGYGTLPDQQRAERDIEYALDQFQINAGSAIALLSHIANRMQAQGHGCIAAISSVAGDRGRKSNYIYGSAKAALSTYLQGLRNRLAAANVTVLTIKPGFVITPMTQNFDKGLLWVGAEYAGTQIYKAIKKNKDIVYVPWFWRFIMFVIRSIPERIFKRTSL